MPSKAQIEELLKHMDKMNTDYLNKCEITKVFNLDYKDEYGLGVLHTLVDEKYNEEKCLLAIKALLNNGANPNALDNAGYNFIQTALYTGYSENFIVECLRRAIASGLNVNHVDEDGDTLLHTAIYSDDYKDRLDKIYELLAANGFNFSIKDGTNNTVVEAMRKSNKYSKSYINSFCDLVEKPKSETVSPTQSTSSKSTPIVPSNCIDELLPKLNFLYSNNLQQITSVFNNINYEDDEGQSLLHLFVDKKRNEIPVLMAIQTLLLAGVSPNATDNCKYNFIQTALYAGYSESFIIDCLKEALKYKLDVNHVDEDGDTIIHTAIYSDDYSDTLSDIYKILCQNRFDSNIKNKSNNGIDDALFECKKYPNDYKRALIHEFDLEMSRKSWFQINKRK